MPDVPRFVDFSQAHKRKDISVPEALHLLVTYQF